MLRMELDQLFDTYARELTSESEISSTKSGLAQGVAFLFALDYGILEAGWCSHRHLSLPITRAEKQIRPPYLADHVQWQVALRPR